MYQPEKVIRILAKLSQKQKGNKDTADRSLQI